VVGLLLGSSQLPPGVWRHAQAPACGGRRAAPRLEARAGAARTAVCAAPPRPAGPERVPARLSELQRQIQSGDISTGCRRGGTLGVGERQLPLQAGRGGACTPLTPAVEQPWAPGTSVAGGKRHARVVAAGDHRGDVQGGQQSEGNTGSAASLPTRAEARSPRQRVTRRPAWHAPQQQHPQQLQSSGGWMCWCRGMGVWGVASGAAQLLHGALQRRARHAWFAGADCGCRFCGCRTPRSA